MVLNLNNVNQVDFLVNILAGKIGIDPKILKEHIQSGNIEAVLERIPEKEACIVRNILANQNTVNQILCSKEVRNLINQLNNINGGC